MTGIRWWIGLSRSFASVVMMAQDEMRLPSESLLIDQSPAKAKGSPDRIVTRMGRLVPPVCCHS